MQFMPVVTAIIPKLYENSCDCLLIVHHAVQNKRVSHTSNGRAEHSLLLAHDSGRKTVKWHLGLD